MFDESTIVRQRAQSAVARGDLGAAAAALLDAAGRAHVGEHEYRAVLGPLEEVYVRQGEARAALTLIAYVGTSDATAWKRAAPLLHLVPAVDRAMAAAAQGHMADAAREMENAGRVAAAAIFRERAGDWGAARALWSRLSHGGAGGSAMDPYVAALVGYNLARCAKRCGDAAQARQAIVACVRLLEEAADHFESIGQRERAFDCFQVLVDVGRESGAFEDVLEGFVNCIRILREDHLRRFALEYYDASIGLASECGEVSAAATFAREGAEYARSLGLHQAAKNYVLRQAELWRTAAKMHADRGAPPGIVAHSLLAAILPFAEAGQYGRVGQIYTELAMMDLEPRRREHYAHAAQRYQDAHDEPHDAPAPPRADKVDAGLGDVWRADVIEWEQRGSAAEACADVMTDRRWLDLIRRKAMLARLTALQIEARGDPAADRRAVLASQLAELQSYAVLSPLEKLFEHPNRLVKIAVLDALQTLYFKRSFVTVRAALHDADPMLVHRASRTVEALQFPHAFDPLARIFRESLSPGVRAAALRALSHIDTPEAAEMLLGVLEHGAPHDRVACLAALKSSDATAIIALARDALKGVPPSAKTTLRDLLAARGVAT
jgi:HEAT repeat protein